mgnify:CR=1 FL=1
MANTYLYRTPSSAGNRGIWTVSWWSKKCDPTKRTVVFGTPGSDNNSTSSFIYHQDSGVRWGLQTYNIFTTTDTFVMRDPSSWYHLVLSIDSSQGSSDNRTKFYINGERFTDWSSNNLNNITNGFQYGWNNTILHTICKDPAASGTDYFSGNITHFVNIDGQALTPTSFGETDSTTGEWKPKEDLSGLTFGTNGCWLKFENAANLGLDSSGNGNNWTVSGAGTNPQSTDTASNNFATYNPLAKDGTPADNHDYTLANTVVQNSSNNWFTAFGSLGIPTSGKWYYEYTTSGSGTIDQLIGFAKSNFDRGSDAGADTTGCYTLYAASNGNGFLFTNSGSSVNKGTSYCWTHGDTMMVAIDSSARKIWYGKNGTWLSGGNPATGTTEDQTVTADDMAYGLLPVVSGYHTGSLQKINFGNPAYTISSGNADSAGFGNFEYAVPSGYYALCTKNINSYG